MNISNLLLVSCAYAQVYTLSWKAQFSGQFMCKSPPMGPVRDNHSHRQLPMALTAPRLVWAFLHILFTRCKVTENKTALFLLRCSTQLCSLQEGAPYLLPMCTHKCRYPGRSNASEGLDRLIMKHQFPLRGSRARASLGAELTKAS